MPLARPAPHNPLLEPKVLVHLQPALRAYFDYKDAEPCFQLYGHLAAFISEVCGRLDEKILALVHDRTDGKSLEDWVSWYVEAIKIIQAATLSKFNDLIAHSESFDARLDNKISCMTAVKYVRRIGVCYKTAHQEYLELLAIEPRSRKHRDKRGGRIWTPYLGEFIPCRCE